MLLQNNMQIFDYKFHKKVRSALMCHLVNIYNNFRLIAILPIFNKIFEKAVHQHLYCYLSELIFINENQSGFRHSHFTETCLINMTNDWTSDMNYGNMTGVAFIDLRKAFETVNHDI